MTQEISNTKISLSSIIIISNIFKRVNFHHLNFHIYFGKLDQRNAKRLFPVLKINEIFVYSKSIVVKIIYILLRKTKLRKT